MKVLLYEKNLCSVLLICCVLILIAQRGKFEQNEKLYRRLRNSFSHRIQVVHDSKIFCSLELLNGLSLHKYFSKLTNHRSGKLMKSDHLQRPSLLRS